MPTKRSGLLVVGLQSQPLLESKSVFSKLRESVNPEEIMPIGIAITAIPNNAVIAATIFPAAVSGDTSP